jgi:hypothetical protein
VTPSLQIETEYTVVGSHEPRSRPVQLLLAACVLCSGGLLLALAALLPAHRRLALSHRACHAERATRVLVQVRAGRAFSALTTARCERACWWRHV